MRKLPDGALGRAGVSSEVALLKNSIGGMDGFEESSDEMD